jgi:glutathione S-transferase
MVRPNAKALKSSDRDDQRIQGDATMIIFGTSLSPFARKVLIAAAEKQVVFDHRQTGLGADDPEFLAASPFRKIPALVDGDFSISDSTAILTYLEAIRPEPNLLPVEARARARTVWYEEFGDTILIAAIAKVFFNRIVAPRFLKREGDLALADQAIAKEIPPLLDYLEGVMPPSLYLVEDRFTYADLSVFCPLLNLEHGDDILAQGRWPKVLASFNQLCERPSIAPIVAAERKLMKRK